MVDQGTFEFSFTHLLVVGDVWEKVLVDGFEFFECIECIGCPLHGKSMGFSQTEGTGSNGVLVVGEA